MKLSLTIGLLVCLIFSISSMAAAEVLFGVSGEAGRADIAGNYDSVLLTDVSDTFNQFALSANLNLLGTHIDLSYGFAETEQYTLSTADLRIGWQFGLDILKVKAFGGGEFILFNDDTLPSNKENTYTSIVVGVGAESKFSDFTIHGLVLIPLETRFKNLTTEDNDADISLIEAGIAYAPMPFVDLFLKYRAITAESNYLDLETESYTFGVQLSF